MARQLEQIIESQVRAWTEQQKELTRRYSSESWPIITIAREFGARGSEVSRLLGEKTGFMVWDGELVHEIAKKCGGDETILHTLDEHRRNAIDDAVSGVLMGAPHTNLLYLRSLIHVVDTIAARGNAIIVGRGAHYIVRNRPLLRVRIVCPLDIRVRWYAEQHQVDAREARRIVEEMDTDRIEFIRITFRKDATCSTDYDLVLNSGIYSLEQIADMILQAYQMRFSWKPARSVRKAAAV